MKKVISKNTKRLLRKHRITARLHGTASKPRLVIFKSLKYIYVQMIDDEQQNTIASFSTHEDNYFNKLKSRKNKDAAKMLGEMAGNKAIELGIKQVIFDRNGYKYHGNVKIFAEAARKKGLVF